jgi:hypothetical protein
MAMTATSRRGLLIGAGTTLVTSLCLSSRRAASAGNSFEAALANFASQFAPGMFPLPPNSSLLGQYTPNLSGILRDAQGIIGSNSANTYPCNPKKGDTPDEGDAAHHTGFAVFCNSKRDQSLLPRFENGHGLMVRHPTQPPWNNPKNCTRDQLIAFTSGCWRANRLDINQRLLDATIARFPQFTAQDTEETCPGTDKHQPGDPLLQHDMMALAISAGHNAAYLDLGGQFALQCAIQFGSLKAEDEVNQTILQVFRVDA